MTIKYSDREDVLTQKYELFSIPEPNAGVSTFGSVGVGTSKWWGGVLAPNGKIYAAPSYSSSILEIDPIVGTAKTFGSISGNSKYAGAVLAKNGKIYCIPNTARNILEIDPISKTSSTFATITGTDTWSGGVLADNGKIYCIPFNSRNILVIDPIARSTSTIVIPTILPSGSSLGGSSWSGGVLAQNGKIYAVPNSQNTFRILIITPSLGIATYFGNVGGATTNHWSGCALSLDGKIYAIPGNESAVLKIDPILQTTTEIGNFVGSDKWRGGVLSTNGKIYGIPNNSLSILEIDTSVGIATTLSNVGIALSSCAGGVLGKDGKIYCIPSNSSTVFEIGQTTATRPSNILFGPHLNKF